MSDFTAGPWHVDEFSDPEVSLAQFGVWAADDTPVAALEPLADGTDAANACLIAAAPELLEALAALLAHARAHSRAPHADALYKADSALRKAEGRQP